MTAYSGNTVKKKKRPQYFREVAAKQKDTPAQSGPLQVVATKRVHASHSCLQGQGASFCLCAEHQAEHSMETNVWENRVGTIGTGGKKKLWRSVMLAGMLTSRAWGNEGTLHSAKATPSI